MRSTPLPEILSVVAVPIGNPKDLTPRAAASLSSTDLIFCEDTRKTAELFKRAEITHAAKLIAIPGDSEHDVDWMRYCAPEYRKWAVVSDAGTPIVNDPGVSLVGFCRKHQVLIEALPGASAPILAWQWSGGFGLPFLFAGFAPKVSAQSQTKWEKFIPKNFTEGTFCFFDTRHQVLDTLEYLSNAYPQANLYIAREMTKSHEELMYGSAKHLHAAMELLIKSDKVGELCLLLDLSTLKDADSEEGALSGGISADDLIKFHSASTKDASKMMAKWCNITSREAYKRLCDET